MGHPENAEAKEALTIMSEITAAFTDFPMNLGSCVRIALAKGGKII